MLLDRHRINKWAKWVALALVIVFAIGFVALGVGSGGVNLSSLWDRSNTGTAAASGPEQVIANNEAILAEDPTNQDALLGLANAYKDLGMAAQEAYYLELLAPLQPGKGELYLRLARLYMSSDLSDYKSAVTALQKATSLDTNNAEAYLQLGIAERYVGNTNDAIMAWTRYLALAPEGEMAATVEAEIEKMTTPTTTGADASSTATTVVTPTNE